MLVIEVYFDGLCKPINPNGVATYGFLIYKSGSKVHEESGLVGAGCLGNEVTNNIAEYIALIKALEWLVKNKLTNEEITVKGDSQLVIRQLNKTYSVRASRIVLLYEKALSVIKRFKSIKFTWIPREYNKETDSLSKRAYYEFCKKHRNLVRNYYAKYFITEKQRRYILYLAKRRGLRVEISEFMSKGEASKLIQRLKY